MEHRIETDAANGLFTITTNGEGSEDGIIAFLNDLIAHPGWRPGMSLLLDHRELSIKKIKPPGVELVSEHFVKISGQLGDGKCALVMNRDVDFGIARAWELLTADKTSMQLQVFRSMDQARDWLAEEEAGHDG